MKIVGILLLLASALFALGPTRTADSQAGDPIACETIEQSTETVAAGVTVTWDSSLWCPEPPETGAYAAPVTIAVDPASSSVVSIESVALLLTTPRPGGTGPEASAVSGDLPVSIGAGGESTIAIEGNFELVTMDEGARATLHLRIAGVVDGTGEPFFLATNIHLGALDEDNGEGPPEGVPGGGGDDDEGEGPPEWAGGPPPWAPGPPPWAGSAKDCKVHQ
ncbi:hypothetical protein BH23CHL2_BH23CHL2_15200 [soil metagenome]